MRSTPSVRRTPRGPLRRFRVLLLLLVGAVLLSGCDFDVYKLPLPGGTDVGDDPITVTAEFADVLDLVPQSTVKVNDVNVGKITDVSLDGFRAQVTMELRKDTELPDNALAEIRQTSLLGEKFVSLSAPADPSAEPLGDGDTIDIDSTGRNPEVEEVLGALSLVLNGGGVAQLKTITQELNLALEGREDSARSVLTQVETLVRNLDDNKGDIVEAIDSLNQLAISVRRQQGSIDSALEELPSALKSLDSQRADLVTMLKALDRLSGVGVRVIKASKDATINSLELLKPVLTQLADSGDDFVNAFNVFLTFPFVDEVVGRDPQVARNLHPGDYTNLSIQLDLDLTQGLPQLPGIPDIPCIALGDLAENAPLPPLDQLCEGAIDAINECLTNPTAATCLGLPGAIIDEVCAALPVPVLCPGVPTSGPSLPLPSITLPTLTLPTALPSLGLPTLLPGLLGRAGTGTSSSPPTAASSGRGPTMEELMDEYDPALVSLMVPGMVMDR